MMRPQPRSTRTDPSFPTRRSSDLNQSVGHQPGKGWLPLDGCPLSGAHRDPAFYYYGRESIRPANFSDLSESGLAAGSEQWTGAITTIMKRSEEHTSELQSLMRISYAVFCLKKKKLAEMRTI